MLTEPNNTSLSLWNATVPKKEFPKLKDDISTDVCVVGGGIAGLTTAYLLLKQGKKVCVLEASEIGSGQTGRTTAHFTVALDDRYFVLENYHGVAGAKMAAESQLAALKEVERIVSEEKIDCDFEHVNGYLFLGDNMPLETLNRELSATHRAGIKTILVGRAPLENFDTGPALQFSNQIQLHPMKYLHALSDCILKMGGQIFTHTHVLEVQGGHGAFVKTKDGKTVKAKSLVVATNTPINDLFAIHSKQAPYRTYAIAMSIPKGNVPKGLYWDTEDPYHYVRVQSSSHETDDVLIVGGEDHKTGQNNEPAKSYSRLEQWTRKRFPEVKRVDYCWSGQVMEPMDGMAFLGHNPLDPDNVYVITGDSGNGMTQSTVGALLITDQILGQDNAWEFLYNPSRITFKAIGNFIKENANVAAQIGDWFTGGQIQEIEDIRNGEGAVFRNGLKKLAVYKSPLGVLKVCSAACPHLGCVVAWNTAEKTWDCPCHGSRFDSQGKVLEGPSVTDLKPAELPVEPRFDQRPLPVQFTPEQVFD